MTGPADRAPPQTAAVSVSAEDVNMSLHAATGETGDGTRLEIRPIRPEDEPLLLTMSRNPSAEKLRPPCLGATAVLPRDALARLCRPDNPRDSGFVAEWRDARGTPHLDGLSGCFSTPKAARRKSHWR